MPIKTEGDIFGLTTISSSSAKTEPGSKEDTAAGKLIDHLKFVADTAIDDAANRADWLAHAANQGQNTDAKSLVKAEQIKPNPLTRAAALAKWDLPAISATPLTLPTLPDNLKVDFEKLSTQTKADIDALKASWMAQFLPAVTDVSALNKLFDNTLDGVNSAKAEANLATLEGDLSRALDTIINSTRGRMDQAVVTVKLELAAAVLAASNGIAADARDAKSNLAARVTDATAGVGAALDAAKDNAGTIAWVRARDNAAREAARQESEAASAWAARGWSMPGGALAGVQAKARQATLNVSSDMAAQQAEKQQQFFLEAARASVEAYLRIMDVQSNADQAVLRANIDASLRQMDLQINADLSVYKDGMDADLRFADMQLTSNRDRIKQSFEHLQLKLDFTKFSAELATRYRLGVIEGMNNLIRAYAALKGNEMEYLATITKAQQGAQSAVLDYYRAALAAAELGMRVDVTNTDTDVKWASIAAQFIGTSVGHHVQAATAATDVFARVAAMALSGLNGIASIAASA